MNSNFPNEETIAAIASAVSIGQGGIAVVRISGKFSKQVVKNIVNIPGKQEWKSHKILYGYVVDQQTNDHIDEVLILIMDGPRSFTGEDVVEIHCHGGLITVQRVLEQILHQSYVRRALPGEFSQRAVLNGRLSLTQAEAINELIKAKTEKAAQLAMAGIDGDLNNEINALRNMLLDQLSEIEARIDFEDDLPPLSKSKIINNLETIYEKLNKLITDAKQCFHIRNGLKVALIGLPNVGKSSLLNLLSKKDKAIVTDIPGTTRDLLESEVVLKGVPITFIDTAGIRSTKNVIEKIGIAKAEETLLTADIIILIYDVSLGWNQENQDLLNQIPKQIPKLIVGNKADLKIQPSKQKPDILISALNGEGEESFVSALFKVCGATTATDIKIALNERQIDLVISSYKALGRVLSNETKALPWDFWTIDLRESIHSLGELTGEDISEAVLDRIFSRFCIGK